MGLSFRPQGLNWHSSPRRLSLRLRVRALLTGATAQAADLAEEAIR
eukprot:CAMPEP_0171113282 /NCGR_PEP_ID=MMETSP0766_2-20121228/81820_1 /TAXON_ID=439317 /ORGANISM="Gambierdiscus australes, Strain CAWD 149" /LENGTH=45 /DNA_ID= /DNA_START= /DNA_END= /DNA_ORIENTATION=